MRTATPKLARAINDRLVLDLLVEHGSLTAPQLRALTGLSRPTVSDLIERLQVNGLIEVTGESGGDRRGPNARLYGVVAARAHVAGVDVRRDVVHVSVADITGGVVGTATRPLSGDPPSDLPSLIAATIARAAGSRALRAVVAGVPGLVDPRTGDLQGVSEVPGWGPGSLAALRHLLDVPVILENDVNLVAVAEHAEGVAEGRDDFVLLWLDEGLGSAVVLGGRLRRGVSGGAGEVSFLEPGGVPSCDLVAPGVLGALPPDEVAERIASVALAPVAVLDPGLVVLAGDTGVGGGEEMAAMVAGRLAERSPVPVQVRVSTVAGNPILSGAVVTALTLVRDEVFGAGAAERV
ncbi:ROK family transcriptional regulator [Spongiactinospora sp. TRM90649]|uniref:ROK family transcriptional regulator n=1 Tax=Spongiactinospora sp. TRM90649 TaxID=3031114 RepID=UPI0023F95548|nr:ROK family transcriptional regulator [Spongiactinospora sp. TRM90649]MDF5756984.1 ROK family transcriptional regulator [Spongiactinospora sp. TRM90649]